MTSIPEDLSELLEDLREEIDNPKLPQAANHSRMRVSLRDQAFELGRADSSMLLHSPDTVQRFYDALGRPPLCTLELIEIVVEDEVREMLEHLFSSVEDDL